MNRRVVDSIGKSLYIEFLCQRFKPHSIVKLNIIFAKGFGLLFFSPPPTLPILFFLIFFINVWKDFNFSFLTPLVLLLNNLTLDNSINYYFTNYLIFFILYMLTLKKDYIYIYIYINNIIDLYSNVATLATFHESLYNSNMLLANLVVQTLY